MPFMTKPNLRKVAFAGILAVFAPAVSACYVESELPPPAYADGYDPQLYDGYVVYYDDVGRPYYYAEGRAVWVPTTAPVYVGLVDHWRGHGPAYHRWYGHYGHRYYRYRAYGRGGHRR